jgi:hypothetical protein
MIIVFSKDRPDRLAKTLHPLASTSHHILLLDDSCFEANRVAIKQICSELGVEYHGAAEQAQVLSGLPTHAARTFLHGLGSGSWNLGYNRNYAVVYSLLRKANKIILLDDDILFYERLDADKLLAKLDHIPSVQKRIASGGFYFHACKDSPDVRTVLLHYLRDLPCEAEVVVARKIPALFEKQHHARAEEFYADLLAHLIKNRLKRPGTLVLNVAERGSSTREKVLTEALRLARERAAKKWGAENLQARVVFNVQNPRTEPLLTVSDYLCWAVQRVFEQGEVRHYNYLAGKIRLVVDLYDREKYAGNQNFYHRKNPLTAENKLGPPVT